MQYYELSRIKRTSLSVGTCKWRYKSVMSQNIDPILIQNSTYALENAVGICIYVQNVSSLHPNMKFHWVQRELHSLNVEGNYLAISKRGKIG